MRYSSARPRSVSASSTVRLWPTNAASASASSPVMTMGTIPSPPPWSSASRQAPCRACRRCGQPRPRPRPNAWPRACATDHMRGCRGLDLRQARRSGRKRAGAKCQARRDDAADKGSVRIDDLDIGRSAQVDHDARRAVDGTGRHGVGDAVGTDLCWIIVVHGHAGLETRPHGEHAPRAGAGKRRLPRALERRHYAAQHGRRGHERAGHARIGRQRGHDLSETHTRFVGRNARRRRDLARRKRAFLRRGRILGKQAKANECVAHVDRQYICAPIKHRRRSFRLPSSISPTQTS